MLGKSWDAHPASLTPKQTPRSQVKPAYRILLILRPLPLCLIWSSWILEDVGWRANCPFLPCIFSISVRVARAQGAWFVVGELIITVCLWEATNSLRINFQICPDVAERLDSNEHILDMFTPYLECYSALSHLFPSTQIDREWIVWALDETIMQSVQQLGSWQWQCIFIYCPYAEQDCKDKPRPRKTEESVQRLRTNNRVESQLSDHRVRWRKTPNLSAMAWEPATGQRQAAPSKPLFENFFKDLGKSQSIQ